MGEERHVQGGAREIRADGGAFSQVRRQVRSGVSVADGAGISGIGAQPEQAQPRRRHRRHAGHAGHGQGHAGGRHQPDRAQHPRGRQVPARDDERVLRERADGSAQQGPVHLRLVQRGPRPHPSAAQAGGPARPRSQCLVQQRRAGRGGEDRPRDGDLRLQHLQVLPRVPADRGGARGAREDQRGDQAGELSPEVPRTKVQFSEAAPPDRARTVRIVLGLVGALILAGCASATAVRVERSDVIGSCLTAVPQRDVLLGVALSGGGSRAALFGSAGLEALARLRTADGGSVIDKIAHVSSVSGGSIAAAYYVQKKPGRGVNVLNADGTLSDAYRAFFETYRTDLSQDFETSLIWRQLLSFRWVNSALAAHTLAEILGTRLYGPARWQELSAREKAGDSPGLIVNATLYNNGRRLAITSLPPDAFDYDFFLDLERSLRESGRKLEPGSLSRERWNRLRPMTLIEINIDPCPAILAAAVTASASFPPLVGKEAEAVTA